jgi:hypothetical protein
MFLAICGFSSTWPAFGLFDFDQWVVLLGLFSFLHR